MVESQTAPDVSPAPTSTRELREYRPSRGVNLKRLALGLALSVLLGAIAGVIYSALVFYVPFLKLRFLITLLAGLGIGAMTLWLVRVAHVRRATLAIVVAMTTVTAAYYVSWASWIGLAISDMTGGDLSALTVTGNLLVNPAGMVEFAQFMLEEGFWVREESEPVKGTALAVIWLIEAGVLLGVPLVMAIKVTGEHPYCEACGSWTTQRSSVAALEETEDREALRQELLDGDLDALADLGPADFLAPARLRVERDACPNCGETQCMTVWHVAFAPSKDGSVAENKTAIVRHLRLTPEQAAWVDRDLAAARPITPPEAAADDDDDADRSTAEANGGAASEPEGPAGDAR